MTRWLLPTLHALAGLLTAAVLLTALLNHKQEQDLLTGAGHPLFLDHLFALLVVGLWAGRLHGSVLWVFPSTFLVGMGGGFLLAVPGPLAPMEPVIEIAMFVATAGLAAAAALGLRPSWLNAIAGLGVLGLCHGLTDRVEAGPAELGPFALGYLVAAGVLLLLGVSLGLLSRRAT